jgi:hypothetical protein
MARDELTIASILEALAGEYTDIVPEREVMDRVLAHRPSQAKDPYARIRNVLRYEGIRRGWVPLGNGMLAPLHVVLQGLRFRAIPGEDEVEAGLLAHQHLRPFVRSLHGDLRLEDATGAPLPIEILSIPVTSALPGPTTQSALNLGDWFRREQFRAGDSILVTVTATAPLTLRLEREPAPRFDADAAATPDRELADAVAACVARSSRRMVMFEECILAVFARAPWRTGYPGQPWQQVIARDRRLRLLDGAFIVDASFRRPLDWLFGEELDEEAAAAQDAALLEAISAVQRALLASRRADAAAGLWNGIAPRASTARVIFDMRAGTSETIYPGVVNALEDHSATIEEHLARGDYVSDDDEWEISDELDDDDLDDALDDALDDLDTIEDIQEFLGRNPALGEAARRLMDSLSPEELARLQQAESLEDAQQVLTGRLSELLRTEPALFAPLRVTPDSHYTNGNGTHNGHAGAHDADAEADDSWMLDDLNVLSSADDDETDEELDDPAAAEAMDRSSALIEAFYQHQIAAGRREETAASRAHDLAIYADFLARYYQRSLEAGDYATLDEFLLFFYPRRVFSSSPTAAREVCTSIKQFYGYLRADRRIADDRFAAALWRRRDQVAQVVELYEQIDSDSPQFERLFAHLFAPYTA